MNFVFSKHAQEEMERRAVPLELLQLVLNNPQQVVAERDTTKAFQSKVVFEDGRTFLLRAIVSDITDPTVVVTVYRTSRIEKYWRQP